MQTARLKTLMEEVLRTLSKPRTEDVIEDVFCAIEQNPRWRKEYADLEYGLGRGVVNAWGGFWIAHAEGRAGGEHVAAKRSSLIDSYSKLAKRERNGYKKVKEPEALAIMSEYFFANKESLPATIRKHRVLIVELIKEGFPPADAFAKVLEKPTLAH
jgi:hypothetical protein